RVDAELLRVDRIERVLRVDEGDGAAEVLRLRHHVQGDGRLARRLRTVDLGDPAARQAADSERDIERERPRGNDRNLLEHASRAKAHDRALAELPLDLREGEVEGLPSVVLRFRHGGLLWPHSTRPDG